MQMKAKFVDPERIVNNLDTAIRDAEIRAFWEGLKRSDYNYKNKMLEVMHQFHVSYDTVSKVISAKK